jgi:uncharacterized ferritin-like protein (DUF455 family)
VGIDVRAALGARVQMGFAIREKAEHLLTFHGIRLFLMEMVASWTPTTPELEAKVLFGRQIWDAAQHADMLGRRALELRAPLQPTVKIARGYVRILERMAAQTGTAERIQCLYEVVLPGLAKQYQRYLANTHHLQDEPTVRLLDSIQRDDARIITEAHDILAQMGHLEPAGFELLESLHVALEETLKCSLPLDAVSLSRGGVGHHEVRAKTVRGVTLRGDPAREPCFRVASTADEMFDMAGMSPESRRERLHRHMNNEIVAIEIAAQCLVDFPEADWDLRLQLARQCWDESRHATALKRRLLELGGFKGEFPISNYEWNVTSILDSLAARLAVQNRIFEAGLMDLLGGLRKLWRAAGDETTAAVLESILADEVGHVRFANQWIRRMAKADRRVLLQVAQGIGFLKKAAVTQVSGNFEAEDIGRNHYQLGEVNVEDRKLAGFTDEEINSFLTSVGLASVLPPRLQEAIP